MIKVTNSKKKSILNLVEESTSNLDLTKWSGTLKDYLPMVLENPSYNETSHSRVCRMIEEQGVDFIDKTPKYKFFEDELFGIDHVLAQVMEFFRAAGNGSDAKKRLLLLWGPTSSGKSQFVTTLKKGLELFSRTESGRLFAIDGCPMFENPLNAIPHSARKGLKEEYGISIEGDLCPKCAYRLQNEFGEDFWKIPVKRIFLSEMNRIGIGTFQPADKKSQSQSELTGSVNFAKLEEFGVESHPLAYNFDGELNISNRGVMEFIELLKVDPKFRYILLTLVQEKRIKTERFPLIYADLVPVGHSNETEFLKFRGDKTEEALHDRLWLIPFPYNLGVDNEVRIYEKLMKEADGFKNIHIAPHTLKIAAMFAILSRLEEPKDKSITILQKMHLYNGKDVDGFTKEDIKELQKSAEREGLDGVSPRYIINRLSACLAKHGATYITPISALRSIKEGLPTNAKLDDEAVEKLENLVSLCVEEYNKIAMNEVQKAFFVNFEYEINNLLENYLDNVAAYLDDSKCKNEWDELVDPDEELMRSVEEKVEITSTGKDSFRSEVYRKMLKTKNEDGEYKWQSHPKLKEALQKQLFEERADTIRLTVSTRNPEPEALKKLNSVISSLVDYHGYTAESANELLRYVNNIMSRTR